MEEKRNAQRQRAIGLEMKNLRGPIAKEVTLWIQLQPIIAGGTTVTNSIELAEQLLITTDAKIAGLTKTYLELATKLVW